MSGHQHRGPFNYDHHRSQPHYVYRCYDASDRLIYVGCTVNPINRIATHRAQTWWGYQIASVRLLVFPDKQYALDREREAIYTENPRWNVRGRWPSRGAWTAEDFRDYHRAIVMSGNFDTDYLRGHLEKVRKQAFARFGITLLAAVTPEGAAVS